MCASRIANEMSEATTVIFVDHMHIYAHKHVKSISPQEMQ